MHTSTAILLVEDHGLVRHGVQLLINKLLPGAQVHLAGSLREALEILETAGRFDLALLDLTLGDVHGTAGLRRLRDEYPHLAVVVLTGQDDRDTVHAALEEGAMGFISKAAPPEELKLALARVLVERAIYLPQSVSPAAIHMTVDAKGRELSELAALGLTPRQIEILGYVVQGQRNKEIGRRLAITEQMVKVHVTAALRALGVPNRTRALVELSKQGYRVPSLGTDSNNTDTASDTKGTLASTLKALQ